MTRRTIGTIKDPDDPWGSRIPIDEGIVRILKNGEKTLGELRKIIAQYEPNPAYTKMGFLKVLQRLKKVVGKKKKEGDRYQKYYLKDNVLRDITIGGNLYSIDASKEILNNYRSPYNIDMKTFLEELVIGIGVYTLFNTLHSYKLASPKNSHRQNFEKMQAWLKQTIPIKGIQWTIERSFDYYLPKKDYMKKIFEDDESLKFLSKFEKTLKESFPKEFTKCKKTLDNLDSKSKNHKKWLNDLDELEKWKKRCEAKNKRNYNKNLKPNECPRCHYDGSNPVVVGPAKGRVYEKGFVFENFPDNYTGLEKNKKHCPACGYWGTHEEYEKFILRR